MTFVLGWADQDGVFICADSAATHHRPPNSRVTSFGELQQLDRATVEERVVKILELTPRALVAVCGDADAGLDFATSVRTRLLYAQKPLRETLSEVGALAELQHDFLLLFAHELDGIPTLTRFSSRDRRVEDIGDDRYATFGSMPDSKKTLAARLATTIRRHGLPPEARLAGTLIALQAIGITEYLPEHGVGGAFFGASLSRQGIRWQPDLGYLTYPPGEFRSSRFVTAGEPRDTIPKSKTVEKVRVLIREGAGILLSSLAEPPGRVLIPPTSTRTEGEWEAIVREAVPSPFRFVVPSRHFGFLSLAGAKAVYVYNPDLRADGALEITEAGDKTHIGVVSQLMETLELQASQGAFDLTVVTEIDGTDARTYRIAIPSD